MGKPLAASEQPCAGIRTQVRLAARGFSQYLQVRPSCHSIRDVVFRQVSLGYDSSVDQKMPERSGQIGRRSILVVEDEPLLRELIKSALQSDGYEVAAAASASEARRIFDEIDPDGIVMDVDLGAGPSGFELAEALLEESNGAALIFLTNMPDPRFAGYAPQDLPPGIAYLHKRTIVEVETLLETVNATLRGAVEASMRHDLNPDRPLGGLTARQVDVLRLVALGRSNAHIAASRDITPKAVEGSIARIFATLGLGDSADGNTRVILAREFFKSAGQPIDSESAE